MGSTRLPRCCGLRMSKFGVPAPPPPPPDSVASSPLPLGLGECVESYNGNSWPTLRERLGTTSALVLLAQEIGTLEDREGERAASSAGLGWKMLCSPSTPGESGRPKAGVAVFVRTHIGLRWPADLPGVIAPGRVIHTIVDLPGWPPLNVISCYLKSGTGLCSLNLTLLRRIGERLAGKHMNIAGGDWNLDPSLVDSTGLARRVGGAFFVPNT